VQSVVFTPESREFTVELGRQAIWQQAASFVVLGIKHIWGGYDHILFLLSLLMLGGRLRHLIKVVSAFTVAHSLTLSLAVLNVVTLPPRWVESAIALSIVYVAIENCLCSRRHSRGVLVHPAGHLATLTPHLAKGLRGPAGKCVREVAAPPSYRTHDADPPGRTAAHLGHCGGMGAGPCVSRRHRHRGCHAGGRDRLDPPCRAW
jgi:hypothetical protein